jgi:SAM-dependent methyltransferase
MPEDPYAMIADLYDFSYDDFTEDLDFYANLAEIGDGSVLELGAGTGRVALPLALAGFQVVGLDVSEAMLARARGKLAATQPLEGSLELLRGDMTDFDLERRFGLVFIAANTFQHLLTIREQQACLACVARHLAPDGVFAMSVRAPASVSWEEADGWAPLLLHWTRTDLETGDLIMKFCAEQPDPARMVRSLTYIYDRIHAGAVRRSVFPVELRYFTQGEIELLLQQAGLRVTHVYSDYDLTPIGLGDNLVFVARAEGAR